MTSIRKPTGYETIDGLPTEVGAKYSKAKTDAALAAAELAAERKKIADWQEEHPFLHAISKHKWAVGGSGAVATVVSGIIGYQQLSPVKQSLPELPTQPASIAAVSPASPNADTKIIEYEIRRLDTEIKALRQQVSDLNNRINALQTLVFQSKRR